MITLRMGKTEIEIEPETVTDYIGNDGNRFSLATVAGQLCPVIDQDVYGAVFGPPDGALAYMMQDGNEPDCWIYNKLAAEDMTTEGRCIIC